MATTLLMINIGVIILIENQSSIFNANFNAFGLEPIFLEYSLVMICAGVGSYILFIIHVFVLPNFVTAIVENVI